MICCTLYCRSVTEATVEVLTLRHCQGQHNLIRQTFSTHENTSHPNMPLTKKSLKYFPRHEKKCGVAASLDLCFTYAQLDISTLSIFSKLVPKEILSTIIIAVHFQ